MSVLIDLSLPGMQTLKERLGVVIIPLQLYSQMSEMQQNMSSTSLLREILRLGTFGVTLKPLQSYSL
jgi:hypothetical protein